MSRSLLTLQTLLSAHLNALRQSVLAVRAPLRINAYEQLLRRISLFVAEQHAIDRQISKYAMDELIELLAEGERLLAGTDPSTAHKRSRSLTLESRGRKSRRSAPAAFAGIEEIQQRNRKQHQGSGAPEILSKAKAGSATKSGAKSVRDARNAPSMSLDITMSKEDDSPSEEAAFQP